MVTRDTMELREDTIRAQYEAALGLVTGFDHAPRLAKPVEVAAVERSPGIGTRPRFRSTVPGMAAGSTARPGGVRLLDRIEGLGDGLVSPLQAAALGALRRGVAIALALGETFSAQSALAELKKAREGTDVSAIKTAVEKVATASQALGAALYQQQASAGGSEQPAGDQPGSDEDVVEGEIIDEDEQK